MSSSSIASSSQQPSHYQPDLADRGRCSALCEIFTFPLQYLYSPTAVGTPFPCSSYTATEMLKKLHPTGPEAEPRRFLEIGPGTGAITELFIQKMGPNDTLDLVECEEPFCIALSLRFKDPRVKVHHQYIQNFKPGYQFDFVVTAVPLNALAKPSLVQPILEAYRNLPKPGADLVAVEYFATTTAKRFVLWTEEKRREFDDVQKLKVAFFNQFAAETRIVVRNMPPARVFHCTITPD